MARRRLLVVAVAGIAAAVAWWAWPDRLTFQEKRLVGTWQWPSLLWDDDYLVEFMPDRSWRCWPIKKSWLYGGIQGGAWRIRDQELILDWEESPVYRFLRPLSAAIGSTGIRPPVSYLIVTETPGNLTIEDRNGERIMLKCAPAH
jgi:hypothetical protein